MLYVFYDIWPPPLASSLLSKSFVGPPAITGGISKPSGDNYDNLPPPACAVAGFFFLSGITSFIFGCPV